MRKITLALALLFCSPGYAMFCPVHPDNFKIINSGDTLEKVLETCGKPSKQKTYTRTSEAVASIPIGGGVTTSHSTQIGNQVFTTSNTASPAYIHRKSSTQTEYTELYYDTHVLLFVNGILVNRKRR